MTRSLTLSVALAALLAACAPTDAPSGSTATAGGSPQRTDSAAHEPTEPEASTPTPAPTLDHGQFGSVQDIEAYLASQGCTEADPGARQLAMRCGEPPTSADPVGNRFSLIADTAGTGVAILIDGSSPETGPSSEMMETLSGLISVAIGEDQAAEAQRWLEDEIERQLADPGYPGTSLGADEPNPTPNINNPVPPNLSDPRRWSGSFRFQVITSGDLVIGGWTLVLNPPAPPGMVTPPPVALPTG